MINPDMDKPFLFQERYGLDWEPLDCLYSKYNVWWFIHDWYREFI